MKIYLAGKIGFHDWRNTIVSPDALEFINNVSSSLPPEHGVQDGRPTRMPVAS